jgi:UDP-N-acetylglucosamine 2-epimerase (non-hydrolysing)
MIDTLVANLDRLRPPAFWAREGLSAGNYFVVTLHRPANVDDPAALARLLEAIGSGIGGKRAVFPVHPRTLRTMEALPHIPANLILAEPQPYLEFIHLVKHATAVITDSGGITEEATYLGIPCLTLRDSTERPETITIGTNELIGTNPDKLGPALARVLAGEWKKGGVPEKWDGRTGERIVEVLESRLAG